MGDDEAFPECTFLQNELLLENLWDEFEMALDEVCGGDDDGCYATIDFEKLPGAELYKSACDGFLLRYDVEERCDSGSLKSFKNILQCHRSSTCDLDRAKRHTDYQDYCDRDCCWTYSNFEEVGGLSAGAIVAIVIAVIAVVAAAGGLLYWWNLKRQQQQLEPKAAATGTEGNVDQDQEVAQAQAQAQTTKPVIAQPEQPVQVSIVSGTQDEPASSKNEDASLQRKQERQNYLESVIRDIDEKILEKQLAINSTESEENKQLLASFIGKKKVEQAGYAKELEKVQAFASDVFAC